jgi:hypothetical protein
MFTMVILGRFKSRKDLEVWLFESVLRALPAGLVVL